MLINYYSFAYRFVSDYFVNICHLLYFPWHFVLTNIYMRFCRHFKKSIEEEWKPRREHWMKMHFKVFHCRKDSKENPQLLHVKVKVLQHLGLHRKYDHWALNWSLIEQHISCKCCLQCIWGVLTNQRGAILIIRDALIYICI